MYFLHEHFGYYFCTTNTAAYVCVVEGLFLVFVIVFRQIETPHH